MEDLESKSCLKIILMPLLIMRAYYGRSVLQSEDKKHGGRARHQRFPGAPFWHGHFLLVYADAIAVGIEESRDEPYSETNH